MHDPGRRFDTGCRRPSHLHVVPNVPGKRVTIVRVLYGPRFTPAHLLPVGHRLCHQGRIRSAIGGRSVETFGVGPSFLRAASAVHLISANASMTEPAN